MLTVVASQNGSFGLPDAWKILQDGGSALDAVEAARAVMEQTPHALITGDGAARLALLATQDQVRSGAGDLRTAGGVTATHRIPAAHRPA